MKKVIVIVLLLFAGAVGAQVYLSAQSAQAQKLIHAADEVGGKFVVPPNPALSDPTLMVKALTTSAQSAHVNLFRVQSEYSGGKLRLHEYIYLTGPTNFFRSIDLKRGRLPAPADMSRSGPLLVSGSARDSSAIGSVATLGNQLDVTVSPLSVAFDSLPVAGLYYVEPSNSTASPTDFQRQLAATIVATTGDTGINSDTFATDSTGSAGVVTDDSHFAALAVWGLFVVVLVLLAYNELRESKKSGVLQLHGYGSGAIWYRISGRLLYLGFLPAAAIVVAASVVVPGGTGQFVATVAQDLLWQGAVMLAISFVASAYVLRARIATSLKNRKDTRPLFMFNVAVKALLTVGVIVVGAGLAQQYRHATVERSGLGNWSSTRQYGIFYPTYTGDDSAEIAAGLPGPTAAEVFDLYPKLNAAGALYVDASQYHKEALTESLGAGAFRSLQVNPNYLKRYPIKDVNGQPVDIADSTSDWVVLVPQSQRSQVGAITGYYHNLRNGGNGFQSTLTAEQATFGPRAEPQLINQKIRIVIVRDQGVFSFDPDVGKTGNNTVESPIIQVMTIANSAGIDRANAITGSSDTAMKVYLGNTAGASVLHRLEPELTQLHLDDNLTHLVTMNDFQASRADQLEQGMHIVLLVGVFIVLAFVGYVLQGMSITFQYYSRKIAVRRLFGFSLLHRYHELSILLLITWAVTTTAGLVANSASLSPFSTDTSSAAAPTWAVLLIALVVVCIEGSLTAWRLQRTESRRVTQVLKEEF